MKTLMNDLGPSKVSMQAEGILERLDSFMIEIQKLHKEVERLQGIKDLAQIHLNQYKQDYELLHNAYKNANYFVNKIDMKVLFYGQQSQPKKDMEKKEVFKASEIAIEPTDFQVISSYQHFQNKNVNLVFRYNHESKITSLAISNAGDCLAFCDRTKLITLTISSNPTSKVFNFPQEEPIEDYSRCIAFSKDDAYIAASYNGKKICIFDAKTKEIKKQITKHTLDVSVIIFTRDGKYMISAGQDGLINCWSYPNFEHIASLSNQIDPNKSHPITGLCEGIDGKSILVSYIFGAIAVVDVPNMTSKEVFQTFSSKLMGIYASPIFGLYASLSNSTVNIEHITDGIDVINTLKGHNNTILSGSFSNEDTVFVSGSRDESIIMWDIMNTQNPKLAEIKMHHNTIFSIAHSPNSRGFASCGADGYVCYWKYNLPN